MDDSAQPIALGVLQARKPIGPQRAQRDGQVRSAAQAVMKDGCRIGREHLVQRPVDQQHRQRMPSEQRMRQRTAQGALPLVGMQAWQVEDRGVCCVHDPVSVPQT